MQAADVEKLITDRLKDVEVQVNWNGHHYEITAISEAFSGLSTVKRQQLIYGCLSQCLADGSIHAVELKTYTPQQWDERA